MPSIEFAHSLYERVKTIFGTVRNTHTMVSPSPTPLSEPILAVSGSVEDMAQSTIPSSPDYRSFATDYLFQLINEGSLTGKNPDEIATALQDNPILRRARSRQIKGVVDHTIRTGSTDLLEELIITTLPPNPNRQVRRTLKLWMEQSKRQSNTKDEPKDQPKNAKNHADKDSMLSVPTNSEGAKAVEEDKILYPVGRLHRKPLDWRGIRYGVEQLSDDQLSEFIKQRANKLARGDTALLEACQTMIAMIRESPTIRPNSIIARIPNATMVIEGKTHPIYRFSPHRVYGLSFSHRSADELRVTYAIYRQDQTRMLVLDGEGIYTHQGYEKRYKLTGS